MGEVNRENKDKVTNGREVILSYTVGGVHTGAI